jgi:hypothetical protein
MRCAWRAEHAMLGRGLIVALALGAAWPTAGQGLKGDPAVGRWEADSVRRVWTYLDARDCVGAVKELNDGLSRKHALAMVMAGAMYEDGLCLKRNPERAVTMYEQAFAAGRPQQAAGRLTALYASAGPGQDKAAALWWAKRSGQGIVKECGLGDVRLEDAEAFVKAVSEVPAARLDACNYVAGVVGMLQGDVEFPDRAASFGLRGKVQLVFTPALPAFEVKGNEIDTIQLGGVVSGDRLRDDLPSARNEFVRYMGQMTQRALQRFAKPATVPVEWKMTLEYNFFYS